MNHEDKYLTMRTDRRFLKLSTGDSAFITVIKRHNVMTNRTNYDALTQIMLNKDDLKLNREESDEYVDRLPYGEMCLIDETKSKMLRQMKKGY